MRKQILIYGVISGAIVAGLMFASFPFWNSGLINFDNGELVGYTTMVLALSVVFFGIKSCRDSLFDGAISFWKAFRIGILISLIASLMYAIAWEISYHTFASGFMEKMSTYSLEKIKSGPHTEEELENAVAQMEQFTSLYKNPFFRFGITMAEILPVGIVITIISSLLLRKDPPAVLD
jgi:zinc transporter ZupT